MQVGSSPRICTFGYVVLFAVFGTLTAFGQYGQYGQVPGNPAGQQTCNPGDPSCEPPVDQNNYPIRNPSANQQQPTLNPQIIVPGQSGNQNNTSNTQNNNRTQDLYRQIPLPLDPPTEFQLMVANSLGKTLPIYGVQFHPESYATENGLQLLKNFLEL